MSDDGSSSEGEDEQERRLAERLAELSPENRQKLSDALERLSDARETLSIFWSAPLPPPELLADYDRIYPGSAKKIVDAALDAIGGSGKIEMAKVVGAVWLGTVLLAIAAVAAFKGDPWIAVPLGLAGILSAIGHRVIEWLRTK